ncbi:hypothetical protein DFH06DRAFT_1303624 [Mycena polygramma]|nr:hypothetical protein DFH06DRAFT_1303624 [Mycena polygramma]
MEPEDRGREIELQLEPSRVNVGGIEIDIGAESVLEEWGLTLGSVCCRAKKKRQDVATALGLGFAQKRRGYICRTRATRRFNSTHDRAHDDGASWRNAMFWQRAANARVLGPNSAAAKAPCTTASASTLLSCEYVRRVCATRAIRDVSCRSMRQHGGAVRIESGRNLARTRSRMRAAMHELKAGFAVQRGREEKERRRSVPHSEKALLPHAGKSRVILDSAAMRHFVMWRTVGAESGRLEDGTATQNVPTEPALSKSYDPAVSPVRNVRALIIPSLRKGTHRILTPIHVQYGAPKTSLDLAEVLSGCIGRRAGLSKAVGVVLSFRLLPLPSVITRRIKVHGHKLTRWDLDPDIGATSGWFEILQDKPSKQLCTGQFWVIALHMESG